MLCVLPGAVSMARGGQRAVDRQQSQVGDVVCVLDGTSTFADDTRSVMSIQLIGPALYQLRPSAALSVSLVKYLHPLIHLHTTSSPHRKCSVQPSGGTSYWAKGLKPPPRFCSSPPPRFLYKVMFCLNK